MQGWGFLSYTKHVFLMACQRSRPNSRLAGSEVPPERPPLPPNRHVNHHLTCASWKVARRPASVPSPPPPRTAKKASAAAASSRRCCGSSSDASGADRPNWAQSNSSMPRGAGLGGGAHGRGSVRGAKQGEYEAENKEAISRAHSHPYCASCMTATKVGSTLYSRLYKVQQVPSCPPRTMSRTWHLRHPPWRKDPKATAGSPR